MTKNVLTGPAPTTIGTRTVWSTDMARERVGDELLVETMGRRKFESYGLVGHQDLVDKLQNPTR